MSADATIELDWAGETRTFALRIGELLALEDKLDAGCAEILNRVVTGAWRLRDVTETIRLGLMGGGLEGKIARRLVEDHVVPGRLGEAAMLAHAILMAAIVGNPKEPVGKDEAAAAAPEANASPPSPSTETAPS